MRFVRFFQDDEPHLGLRHGDRVFDLTAANEELRGNRLTSVTQLMGHQISPDVLARLMAFATSEERFARRRGDVRLDAPIRDVPKLLALAGNFRKHVEESGFKAVQSQDVITPQVFSKPPSTTINSARRLDCAASEQQVPRLGSRTGGRHRQARTRCEPCRRHVAMSLATR